MLDFKKHRDEFARYDIKVIAASSDTWEQAIQTAEQYKLNFRIGYGIDPRQFSSLTGAFINERENYIHATGFIIGLDGRIMIAVYSTRSVGRLVAKDCLNFIGAGLRR